MEGDRVRYQKEFLQKGRKSGGLPRSPQAPEAHQRKRGKRLKECKKKKTGENSKGSLREKGGTVEAHYRGDVSGKGGRRGGGNSANQATGKRSKGTQGLGERRLEFGSIPSPKINDGRRNTI